MGANTTEAEARAMGELLWERYSIDVIPLDPEAPLETWSCSNGGFRIVISDPEFFGMIPDAIARAAGTAPAKKLKPSNYAAIRDHLFDRIHRTGEHIKNDFPNVLRLAIEKEAWKEFTKADGTPFKDVVEWLHYMWPNGVSMGAGASYAISYEDALQLTEGAPDVHRVLAENPPPASKGGRPPKNKEITRVSTPTFRRGDRFNKSAARLSSRLAQERPKYYEAWKRGEYKSATAAAMAAGLIQDDANLRRAKSAFRMMTASQREEYLEWQRKELSGPKPDKAKKPKGAGRGRSTK